MLREYLVELGLDAIKRSSSDKIDEEKLKRELRAYVIRQRKYNDLCAYADDCDFEYVLEYIKNNLIQDVHQRFFSAKKKERRKAQEEIINKAVAYSNAETDESKKRVSQCIAESLEIIRYFVKQELKLKD